jgi:signal transduction histidine kinase
MSSWHGRMKPYVVSAPVFAVLLLFAGDAAYCQTSSRSSAGLPQLMTAHQAHSLTPEQATLQYRVHLRGVVTFYDPYQDEGRHPALFIQDATGGIFVRLAPRSILPIHAGTLVEVSGVTDPGGFAPIIIQPLVRIRGTPGRLPKSRRVTLSDLLTGAEDGQWVELEGMVHSVESYDHHMVLTLATDGGSLTATTVREDGADYAGLVDSKVLVHAVAAPLVDNKGQMTGVRLLFPGLSAVTIEQRAPSDPFALQVRPLRTLLQYSPISAIRHQVHVRGRLTLYWPGRLLCIQDGNDGLCVRTRDRPELKDGELVDVVGFPSVDNFEPTLSETTIRRGGNSIIPVPTTRITAVQAFAGGHEAELVQIEGRLIGKSLVMTDSALLLSSEGSVFFVILPSSSSAVGGSRRPAWVEGSNLLVTGVFSGKVDTRETSRREGISQLESFQILLRSPDDVVALETPSWWTAQRALMVLGLVVILTLAVMVWVVVLRRRVEQQTLVIRRSVESYRNFVAQSSEGIFRQDLDAPIPVDLPEDEVVHRILYDSYFAECNDATVKMYGLSSQQEFIGKRLTETFDPKDPHNVELTRDYVRSGFRVLERESHEIDILGNPKVFLNSMIGIVENGKLVRTWGIQRDVTERVRLEKAHKLAEQALQESRAELVRAARIATMGELTALIAHEINQPLAAVAIDASAALRWLAADPPDLDEAREAANGAVREASRASRVIERIRTLLKKIPPQLRPLDVNEVIREVLVLAHSELITAGVTVHTNLAADVPTVLGDRVQLQQVFLNLIMNAVDAMTAIRDRPRKLLITSAKDAEEVLVQIQDSGQGLDPKHVHRIFESFFTTKAEGTGMGLSISRSIIEAHGGRLRAMPGSPYGAVFQMALPKAGSNP